MLAIVSLKLPLPKVCNSCTLKRMAPPQSHGEVRNPKPTVPYALVLLLVPLAR